MEDNKIERSSNIELLRIILVIMIIALHYCNANFGGLLGNVENNSVNYWIAHFIESACIIGVNTFIIITGYFSYKKEKIKISKILKLFFQMIFYGLIISFIVIIATNTKIDFKIIKEIAKTSFSRWFVIIYGILYLLIPYINIFIKSLGKKNIKVFLIICLIFFYIWPTFINKTTLSDNGYGIVNFIVLYIIGAYIKIYNNQDVPKKYSLLIYIGLTLITTLFSKFSERAWDYTSIFNLISSICVFEFFKSIKIKDTKIINNISKYTFAIYIIHGNSFLVKLLYRNLFKCDKYWNSNFMFLNLVISIMGIYVICFIIEFIRKLILGRFIDKNIDKIKYEIKI